MVLRGLRVATVLATLYYFLATLRLSRLPPTAADVGAITVPVLFNPPPRFDWSFLNITGDKICGADKCFFRSTKEPGIGYLVTSNNKNEYEYVKMKFAIETGWELSQYLEAKFGIKHFLLQAPEEVNVTSEALINFHPAFFERNHMSFVQKVREKSPLTRIIQVSPKRPNILLSRLSDCYEKKDTNETEFASNLGRDIATALRIIESVPLFALDFQVQIDQAGNLYHLDFDRAFLSGTDHKNFRRHFVAHHAHVSANLQSTLQGLERASFRAQFVDEANFKAKQIYGCYINAVLEKSYIGMNHRPFWSASEERVNVLRDSKRPVNSVAQLMILDLVQTMFKGGHHVEDDDNLSLNCTRLPSTKKWVI